MFPIIELLKNENVDLYKIDKMSRNLLHYSAMSNNIDVCEFLLSSTKIHINAQEITDTTALHFAAIYNPKEILEILLEVDVNINAVSIHIMCTEALRTYLPIICEFDTLQNR